MEVIAPVTGKVKVEGKKVEKPISQLLFTLSGDGTTFSTLTNETVKVSIDRKDGSTVNLIPNIKILPLFLMAQMGEGSGQIRGNELSFFIDLSQGGIGLELSNDENLIIQVDNLKTAKTTAVYGLEFPVATKFATQYDKKIVVAGDETKDLDVSDFDMIAIDNISNLELLEITYSNGINCKYTAPEIRHLAAQVNDKIVSSDDVSKEVPSYNDHLVLGLPEAVSLRLEKNDPAIAHEIVYAMEISYQD